MENTIEPIENPTKPNPQSKNESYNTNIRSEKKAMKKYHFTNGIFYVLNL